MKKNVINTPIKDFTSVNVEERQKIDVRAGDTVKVTVKIKESNKGKEKIRLQIFEGLVLSRKHGNEAGATICVRKVSKGIGVERIFPIYSPTIDKIEIVKKGGVKKSKLYYLREKVAKEIRRQMRRAKLVNVTTTSDIEETEKKIRKAEDAKKAEEEKTLAEEKAKKEAEEKIKAKEEVKKEVKEETVEEKKEVAEEK
jgi:large subunit ribosomal protein L19